MQMDSAAKRPHDSSDAGRSGKQARLGVGDDVIAKMPVGKNLITLNGMLHQRAASPGP
jgi:hypothetical protein